MKPNYHVKLGWRDKERDVKEMFSFPHLMIIAKPVLPPSEIDWLAASDHGDKQC